MEDLEILVKISGELTWMLTRLINMIILQCMKSLKLVYCIIPQKKEAD